MADAFPQLVNLGTLIELELSHPRTRVRLE